MRKSIFLGSMALAACFISCADKDFVGENDHTPVQTGDEIVFATKVSNENSINDADTRTVYGDRSDTGIAVNWEDGDRIMIHCDQASAPASKSVEYEIGIDDGGPDADGDGKPEGKAADEVLKAKTAEAGLQWGDPTQTHHFLAFYPAENVISAKDEVVRAEIPVTQNPERWVEKTASNTGVYTYFGEPDMNNAFMYAHNDVNPNETGNEVSLTFRNLVTVLDITLQGPEDEAVTLSSINVEAYGDNAKDVAITGQFDIHINESQADSPKVSARCEPVDNGTTSNRIVISCYDPINKKYITLNPGQNLNVKAYLLPNSDESEAIEKENLQIVVNPLNNDAPRIKYLTTATIAPHKVNRVLLPKYKPSGLPNYWMSRLNPNVYASQMSLPGSKLSMALPTVNGTTLDPHFQGSDIETQFLDGVRAFNIVVQREGSNQFNSVVEEKGGGTNVYEIEKLGQTLQKIHEQVQAAKEAGAKNEFAFVQLSWCSNGRDGNNWLKELSQFIKGHATDYGIYTGTFDDKTTIGDLEGTVVVMLSVNTQYSSMDIDNVPGDCPVLYSEWKGAAPAESPLCWERWNENSSMKWYASEATSVGSGLFGWGYECTWAEKKSYVADLLEYTLTNYAPGVWVMNDMGGYTNRNDDGGTLSGMNRVTYLTTTLNNSAVQTLQTRSANASLGIIYMNFADMQDGSGKLYQSDWLIQTIIDNNFKFPMQMRSNGGTQTQYNAAYSRGGNAIGWDN